MLENSEREDLGKLGEFGLIDLIKKNVQIYHENQTIKGIDDDAAVLDAKGEKVLVSTDLLVEGVHFDVSYVPLKHLGYKAVMVNISDILAMNAIPKQITVSIAISSKYTLDAIEELYAGILLACENYKIDLVGGDTTTSTKGLVISITAIGYADESKIVYRNGAKEKDLICVSGNIGAAYAGLQLLEREKRIFLENPNVQPDFSGFDYVLERQLKPEARYDIIRELAQNNIVPTAMMDISDGLSSEITHICEQSGVGARIMADKLPIDSQTFAVAEEINISAYTMALNGGEDYELIFSISPSDYDKLLNIQDVTIIGFITEKSQGISLIDDKNNALPIVAKGWNSFYNTEN